MKKIAVVQGLIEVIQVISRDSFVFILKEGDLKFVAHFSLNQYFEQDLGFRDT